MHDVVRQGSLDLLVSQSPHVLSTSSDVLPRIFSDQQGFCWGDLNCYIFHIYDTPSIIYKLIYKKCIHTFVYLNKVTITGNQSVNNFVKLLATRYRNYPQPRRHAANLRLTGMC